MRPLRYNSRASWRFRRKAGSLPAGDQRYDVTLDAARIRYDGGGLLGAPSLAENEAGFEVAKIQLA
jgi:hypothetical protein